MFSKIRLLRCPVNRRGHPEGGRRSSFRAGYGARLARLGWAGRFAGLRGAWLRVYPHRQPRGAVWRQVAAQGAGAHAMPHAGAVEGGGGVRGADDPRSITHSFTITSPVAASTALIGLTFAAGFAGGGRRRARLGTAWISGRA